MSGVPITDIVTLVGGRYDGPRDRVIRGVAPLSEADEAQLSFLSNPKYTPQVETTRAGAIIVANDASGSDPRFIRVANPYLAWATVIARWFSQRPMPQGISPLASIAPTVRMGSNVAVGPFTTIADNVEIGDDVVIFQNVSIQADSSIGAGTVIYPQVSIYNGTRIGRRCIIHSGAVLGADGYGFASDRNGHHKVPQIGIVRVGDDVEIGAGTTIDRAAMGETVIGDGSKIDDQVMVGHGVKIGRHCLLVGQVGISGSTQLGDWVVAAGQAGFAGHLKIGDGAQIGGKSGVFHDIPAGTKVMGIPAILFRDFARREVAIKRLARKKDDDKR